MNVALQKPWMAERFLAWAETQDERYEFDGVQPVAMTGGNARHNRVMGNIHAALRSRLRGTGCAYFGPDLGVATTNGAIRYPDALITCTRFRDSEKIAPEPVVVFEVVSPNSGKTGRIIKMREYEAVRSILRYVMIETSSDGLQVLHRPNGASTWTAQALTNDDVLRIPEVGIDVPVAEFYENVEFEDDVTGSE